MTYIDGRRNAIHFLLSIITCLFGGCQNVFDSDLLYFNLSRLLIGRVQEKSHGIIQPPLLADEAPYCFEATHHCIGRLDNKTSRIHSFK